MLREEKKNNPLCLKCKKPYTCFCGKHLRWECYNDNGFKNDEAYQDHSCCTAIPLYEKLTYKRRKVLFFFKEISNKYGAQYLSSRELGKLGAPWIHDWIGCVRYLVLEGILDINRGKTAISNRYRLSGKGHQLLSDVKKANPIYYLEKVKYAKKLMERNSRFRN